MSGATKVERGATVRQFKPYPAYRDSGGGWLGGIPAHWGVQRLKNLATTNDEALPETNDPSFEILYIDISNVDSVRGIVSKEPLAFAEAPSRARRLVRHGDVIVSTVRTYLRAIVPIIDPDPNLVVSTGFAVVRPRRDLAMEFAAYALRAPYFIDRVVARSVGVSYPAISASAMATFRIAVPPAGEQRAIAAFLDRETGRIDVLVAKKDRLIELLQEKRTALITNAITKGLDPNVPMRDSGVKWLGEIPAPWRVRRLRSLSRLQTGVTLGKRYEPARLEARPYLRVANVQDGYLDLEDITEIELPPDEARRYELRPGDVLMTEGGDFDKLGRG